MNKRGFELSVNFIVTLILAIVVLSFGIYFVRLIYEGSTEMKMVLDQQTEMELERLMDSGEKITLYPGRRTVDNGKMASFGLGVLNVVGGTETFKVKITSGMAGSDITWVQTSEGPNEFPLNIANNAKKKILIGITPTSGSGTYVFNVDVEKSDGTPYDFTHKIYVEVK